MAQVWHRRDGNSNSMDDQQLRDLARVAQASSNLLREGEGIMINSVGTGFYGTFEKNLQVTGVKWRDIEQCHPKTTYVDKRSST